MREAQAAQDSVLEKQIPESGQEGEPGEVRRKQKSYGWRFAVVLALTVAVGAGLFFLWVQASYRMRFSAEFIRAGLTVLYILPCLIGGRILRAWKFPRSVLWAAALGGCVYGLVLLLAVVSSQGSTDWAQMNYAPPVMCVLSAVVGSIPGKKRERLKEN